MFAGVVQLHRSVTARLKGRRRRAEQAVADATAWAARQPSVTGLVLVGSYASGSPTMASDVDLLMLTGQADAYLGDRSWIEDLYPGARLVRTAHWGPVTERRLRLRSGLQVELGITGPRWAALPVDEGTARVLAGGYRILRDVEGELSAAAAALATADATMG